jgi:transcriptional regulator with XRE-family HTH domain
MNTLPDRQNDRLPTNIVRWTGHIGESIRALRLELGWSQRKLAGRAGLSPDTISQLEAGSRSDLALETIIRIQVAMGLTSIEQILGPFVEFPSDALASRLRNPPTRPTDEVRNADAS